MSGVLFGANGAEGLLFWTLLAGFTALAFRRGTLLVVRFLPKASKGGVVYMGVVMLLCGAVLCFLLSLVYLGTYWSTLSHTAMITFGALSHNGCVGVGFLTPRGYATQPNKKGPSAHGPRRPLVKPGTATPADAAEQLNVPADYAWSAEELLSNKCAPLVALADGGSIVYMVGSLVSGEGYVGMVENWDGGRSIFIRIYAHLRGLAGGSTNLSGLLKSGAVTRAELFVVLLEVYPAPVGGQPRLAAYMEAVLIRSMLPAWNRKFSSIVGDELFQSTVAHADAQAKRAATQRTRGALFDIYSAATGERMATGLTALEGVAFTGIPLRSWRYNLKGRLGTYTAYGYRVVGVQ